MDDLIVQAKKNEIRCNILAVAYSIWLRKLMRWNWVLVLGAALLSLIAGFSLFFDEGILPKKSAGFMIFISAAFTVIHTKLDCYQHQAECKKLRGSYNGLTSRYKDLESISDPEEYRKELQRLNEARALIEDNTSAQPSPGSIKEAEKLVRMAA